MRTKPSLFWAQVQKGSLGIKEKRLCSITCFLFSLLLPGPSFFLIRYKTISVWSQLISESSHLLRITFGITLCNIICILIPGSPEYRMSEIFIPKNKLVENSYLSRDCVCSHLDPKWNFVVLGFFVLVCFGRFRFLFLSPSPGTYTCHLAPQTHTPYVHKFC